LKFLFMQKTGATAAEPTEDHRNGAESRLVWEFFGRRHDGVFVEVGANHPTEGSQTWFLEQQGWSGVLVEPNPELQELLREKRPRSRVVQAAAWGPEQGGGSMLICIYREGAEHIQRSIKIQNWT
jgi:hypothetical protein